MPGDRSTPSFAARNCIKFATGMQLYTAALSSDRDSCAHAPLAYKSCRDMKTFAPLKSRRRQRSARRGVVGTRRAALEHYALGRSQMRGRFGGNFRAVPESVYRGWCGAPKEVFGGISRPPCYSQRHGYNHRLYILTGRLKCPI